MERGTGETPGLPSLHSLQPRPPQHTDFRRLKRHLDPSRGKSANQLSGFGVLSRCQHARTAPGFVALSVRLLSRRLTSLMKSNASTTDSTSVAASVAPEDLRCGDFVSVLNELVDFPSFLWCDSLSRAPEELIRVRCCALDGGTPLKIKAICLPFVFVKSPRGLPQTIDVRQAQLVRLNKRYAKTVWQAFRKRAKSKRRGRAR